MGVLRRLARLFVGAVICSQLPRGSGSYSESMSCMNDSVCAQRPEIADRDLDLQSLRVAYGFWV